MHARRSVEYDMIRMRRVSPLADKPCPGGSDRISWQTVCRRPWCVGDLGGDPVQSVGQDHLVAGGKEGFRGRPDRGVLLKLSHAIEIAPQALGVAVQKVEWVPVRALDAAR